MHAFYTPWPVRGSESSESEVGTTAIECGDLSSIPSCTEELGL
jgi:hypothetical protein